MRAVVLNAFGGPEALEVASLPDPELKPGYALVDVAHAGVNFADIHIREDNYIVPVALPYVPGSEVVGTVKGGRRVLALTVHGGGYAERALAPRATTFDVPDDVDDGQALAVAIQGCTAWHLVHTCARLERGESVAVFAAAGGVGTVAIQLARLAGAGRIVAAASTSAKRKLAVDLGADAVVDSSTVEGLADRLIEANGGRKLDVVFEMTGEHTLQPAMAATASFGRIVIFGFASGKTAVVDTRDVMIRNQSLIGFVLPQLLRRRGALARSVRELFGFVCSGELVTHVGAEYGLTEAQRAHEELQSRATTGKLILDTSH